MAKEKQNLIVGIDPGTKSAYAILGMDGRKIAVRSSKGLSLDAMIREVSGRGIPLIVGTDRRKCPQMVSKFSAKTGAAKAVPSYDISETEKNAMTKGMGAANSHEKDAMAAALSAYRQYEPLLRRVNKTLAKERKTEFAEDVAKIVIRRKISIKKALAAIG